MCKVIINLTECITSPYLKYYSLCFLFSYDTWVPSGDIEDEPQPEPQHQGPWQVSVTYCGPQIMVLQLYM